MPHPSIRHQLRFLLNGETVHMDCSPASMTLLDWLREQRRLTGTKEGCAEGDCGACTVLVGALGAEGLSYQTVNACIRFLATLDGCHIVTVEHLGTSESPHPVQQAMIDHHGSQCGFCTPGFVMALYALWMRQPNPSRRSIDLALQGNLCRCTGYAPIIRATAAISAIGLPQDDPLHEERQSVIAALEDMRDGARLKGQVEGDRFIVPRDADDLAAVLEEEPEAIIVAGATDVGLWVTKGLKPIAPAVFIGGLEDLKRIEQSEGVIEIGAAVSYTEARAALGRAITPFASYIDRIGGDQIRNMGTIGGNIANGSPIGDMPPPLIALNATLTLRKGKDRRSLPLEDFFIDYGVQDIEPGEFVETISVPLPDDNAAIAFYKISKRHDEDISSVSAAFFLKRDDAGKVQDIRLAFGGMAAIPSRAGQVETFLMGKAWSEDNLNEAADLLAGHFSPLSDWRATAQYRRTVAANLLRRFYLHTVEGRDPGVFDHAA